MGLPLVFPNALRREAFTTVFLYTLFRGVNRFLANIHAGSKHIHYIHLNLLHFGSNICLLHCCICCLLVGTRHAVSAYTLFLFPIGGHGMPCPYQ